MILHLYLDPVCAKYLRYYLESDDVGILSFQNKAYYVYNHIINMMEVKTPKDKLPKLLSTSKKQHVCLWIGNNLNRRGKRIDVRSVDYWIPPKEMYKVNDFIKELVFEQAFSFISGYMYREGAKLNLGVKKFIYEYGFDKDDLKWDSLKKKFYRDKKADNPKKRTTKALVYKG